MIKSVYFPEDGSGYLYACYEKPEKPVKNSRYTSEETYKRAMEQYREEMEVYRANKGKFVLPAAYNIIGREFVFEDGKINVLFGPNASGKTTVLRAIAGECMIEDGFTCLREPLEFGLLNKGYDVSRVIGKMKQNTAVVSWDGKPLYYDNFSWRKEKSYGCFGDLVGGALGSVGEEIEYHLTSGVISSGQNAVYILNKIIGIVSKPVSLEEIVSRQVESCFGCNDVWRECGKVQVEYFSKFEKYIEESYPVLMFDEIDRSLDIETVWNLYTVFLPLLVERFGCQIILVSHNPLVLSEQVMGRECYNVISMDEAYTRDVKETLKGVKF